MPTTSFLPAFQVATCIVGVPPERVYAHIADPLSLLGLQPLLVAVEHVQHQAPQAALSTHGAAALAAAPKDTTSASAQPPAELEATAEEELCYEAVEAFRFCWGMLTWHNRIRVRQQLLGRLRQQLDGQWEQQQAGTARGDGSEATRVAAAPTPTAAELQQQQVPLGMRFFVASPPLGLVRLEVLWTFRALPPSLQTEQRIAIQGAGSSNGICSIRGDGSGGGGSGTKVELQVAVQAPRLLRCGGLWVGAWVARAEQGLCFTAQRAAGTPHSRSCFMPCCFAWGQLQC